MSDPSPATLFMLAWMKVPGKLGGEHQVPQMDNSGGDHARDDAVFRDVTHEKGEPALRRAAHPSQRGHSNGHSREETTDSSPTCVM